MPAIRSPIEPEPSPTSRTRLSIIGVTRWPVIPAEWRVCSSPVRRPSRIQWVRSRPSPLSKTESVLSEAPAITNGAHSSPAYVGSENRLTPGAPTFSPIRVPPPRLL